jgi:hypothetical protein
VRRLVVLALSVMIAACGTSAARDETARRSWTATADLLIAEWRRGHLPDRYTADTLRVAGDAMKDRRFARAADTVERGDRDARLMPP